MGKLCIFDQNLDIVPSESVVSSHRVQVDEQ